MRCAGLDRLHEETQDGFSLMHICRNFPPRRHFALPLFTQWGDECGGGVKGKMRDEAEVEY